MGTKNEEPTCGGFTINNKWNLINGYIELRSWI